MQDYGLNNDEISFFRTLNSPEKIQEFLDSLKYNYTKNGYDCKSPRVLLRLPPEKREAHCLEGALFAAAAQRINGEPPLMIEMVATHNDFHFIVPFQRNGLWGAMAHSRTYTLKWRDPIHRDIRELAFSYFQGYVLYGEFILRGYSEPVDISCFDHMNWMITEACLEELGNRFDDVPHFNLFDPSIKIRLPPPELEERILRHKP